METPQQSERSWPWFWIVLFAGIALLLVIAISETKARRQAVEDRNDSQKSLNQQQTPPGTPSPRGGGMSAPLPQTPSEVVSNKVSQFARQRRDITYAFASKLNIQNVPPEVGGFYAAIEIGDMDRATTLFNAMWKKKDSDGPEAEALRQLSAPLLETYGVAEAARLWPAEELLGYGRGILDSLKPGMVYIGGTDSGRFIPTLLNDTADEGERHVILTQNALADRSYTQYFDFLHGENISSIDQADSEKAFSAYIADATRRLEHDLQFPDEPKQLRPGENVKSIEGRVAVEGSVAVMQINELILRAFMEKNPDLTFAMEQSFPFESLYDSAKPLGPIFELNAADGEKSFTPEAANATLAYWNSVAQSMASPKSDRALKSYSHMANAQAQLFNQRGFSAQAEQAYDLARRIFPGNIEAAIGLAEFYARQGRGADSERIIAEFHQKFPAQHDQLARWRKTGSLLQ